MTENKITSTAWYPMIPLQEPCALVVLIHLSLLVHFREYCTSVQAVALFWILLPSCHHCILKLYPDPKASPKYHLLLEPSPDSQTLFPPTSWSNNSVFSEITQHHFPGTYYFLSCIIVVCIGLKSPTWSYACWRWDLPLTLHCILH